MKIAICFVVFGLVFGLASHHNKNVTIHPPWGLLVVALVFALLNIGIYWFASPVLNLATLGLVWFLIPFILNGCFLYVTGQVMSVLRIDMRMESVLTGGWLAGLLTLAHGALYLVLDVLV